MHPYQLEGGCVRYFKFRALLFNKNGQFTFSCTADDLEEDNLKPIVQDDDWADAIAIPISHYRGLRSGNCSPALEALLTRIADRQG